MDGVAPAEIQVAPIRPVEDDPIFVSSTSPLEIVLATSTDRTAPTRFSTAESLSQRQSALPIGGGRELTGGQPDEPLSERAPGLLDVGVHGDQCVVLE